MTEKTAVIYLDIHKEMEQERHAGRRLPREADHRGDPMVSLVIRLRTRKVKDTGFDRTPGNGSRARRKSTRAPRGTRCFCISVCSIKIF